MLVRIFQVSLVLVLQSSSFFCNSSSFLDVRVLLTCFCTFCSDFLLILTYILEPLSTGFFLHAGISSLSGYFDRTGIAVSIT